MEKLYLIARIADTRVALRSRAINSVVTVGIPVEVPGAPPHVAGLFALRSRVFTLIDPHVVIGLPPVPVAAGQRVIVVDVVQERLDHALSLGAEAAINARDGDVAARIIEITGGGAHVSVEALGIEATANGSLECLRPMGRHVQVGLPVGHTAKMQINMNAVYM